MGLETGTLFSGLNAAWPEGTDPRSEGDDHFRLLKATLKASFTDTATTFAITKGATYTFSEAQNGTFTIAAKAPHGQVVNITPRSDINGACMFWGAGGYTFDTAVSMPSGATTLTQPTATNDTTVATTAFTHAAIAEKITNKITVANTAPGSPAVNDVWIDTT